jgi:hypothetical protein
MILLSILVVLTLLNLAASILVLSNSGHAITAHQRQEEQHTELLEAVRFQARVSRKQQDENFARVTKALNIPLSEQEKSVARFNAMVER